MRRQGFNFQKKNKKKKPRSKLIENKEAFESMVITNTVFHNPKIASLLENRMLSYNEIVDLCKDAKKHYDQKFPICVVGDIHGQDEDLMTIFRLNGPPSFDNYYLFLGDYINRGQNSLRVILLLFALSVQFKSSFFCLRGNHESVEIAHMYGFYKECLNRFSPKKGKFIFDLVMECCNYLPLCCVINKKLFCCHGGLSPNIRSLNDIEKLYRKVNLPIEGGLADVVWSDPYEESGYYFNKRGAGYYWGEDRTRRFLKKEKLSRIIRAHQLQRDGFGLCHSDLVVTVFSASNYCAKHKNKAAVLIINKDGSCHFLQYYCQKDDSKEIKIGKISKIKLNMNLKKKRRFNYLRKLKHFKNPKQLKERKDFIESLTRDSTKINSKSMENIDKIMKKEKEEGVDDTRILDQKFEKQQDFYSYDQEWEDEKNFIVEWKKTMKRSKKIKHVRTKTVEQILQEKEWTQQYLYNFESSIQKKVETNKDEKRRKEIREEESGKVTDLEKQIQMLQKQLKDSQKKNVAKENKIGKLENIIKENIRESPVKSKFQIEEKMKEINAEMERDVEKRGKDKPKEKEEPKKDKVEMTKEERKREKREKKREKQKNRRRKKKPPKPNKQKFPMYPVYTMPRNFFRRGKKPPTVPVKKDKGSVDDRKKDLEYWKSILEKRNQSFENEEKRFSKKINKKVKEGDEKDGEEKNEKIENVEK